MALADLCVCGEVGERIWSIRNRLLRVMKYYFPCSHDIWKRAALGDGRVFMRFTPELIDNDGNADAQALSDFWGVPDDHRFWHVSEMSFNPYAPMLEASEEASCEDSLGAACGDGEIALKVSRGLPRPGG